MPSEVQKAEAAYQRLREEQGSSYTPIGSFRPGALQDYVFGDSPDRKDAAQSELAAISNTLDRIAGGPWPDVGDRWDWVVERVQRTLDETRKVYGDAE